MKPAEHIIEELKEISSWAASLPREQVWQVPEGYFELLPQIIHNRIYQLNHNIPEGYFDQLPEKLLHKLREQNSNLQLIPEHRQHPEFELPNHYFEQFPDRLMQQLPDVTFSEVLNISGKNLPFEVPANYFEQLPQQLISCLTSPSVEDEIAELSPVLAGIRNKNPFEVPEGYFEQPLNRFEKQSVQQSAGKLISLKTIRASFRYAAAAVMTLVISLSVYKYTSQQGNLSGNTEELDAIVQSGLSMNDQKFNESLNNLKEEEILGYLQQYSTEADVAALSASLETNTSENAQETETQVEASLEKILADPSGNTSN